jgi:GT2 family glycosyltransferase
MGSARQNELSVVMPVHNALPYLDKAVESVLTQTRHDFEFVIYDDASTDGSADRLAEWARSDRRIKLYRGDRNLGPAASSNEVVRRTSASLIARMDADDISLPDRLECQSEFLAANSEAGIVASLCDVIDSHGRKIRGPELWRLARKSWFKPFPHGSMMFRRELFDAIGGYHLECEFWEDLDFVIRASERMRIFVIPRPLYRYRQSTSSTRIASSQSRVENALDLRYRAIATLRHNRDYSSVLSDGRPSDHDRLDPRVFLSLGLLSLWSDQRPSFVRRFLRRARLKPNGATMIAIVWLFLARLSPNTVRTIMNLRSQLSNAAIKSQLLTDEAVEWHVPNRGPDITIGPDEQVGGTSSPGPGQTSTAPQSS